MEIDLTLTNMFFAALTEFGVADVKTVLETLTVKDGIVTIKFNTTNDVKQVVKRLKEYLKSKYDSYQINVVVNSKNYRLRYPNFYHLFVSTALFRVIRQPFYYAMLISLLPLALAGVCLKFIDTPQKHLDETAKSISDNFINVCFLLSTLIITYLITKVVAIKQEKNNRIILIRSYCNQLTEFRRICRNLIADYSFFTNRDFKRHAEAIKQHITFKDIETGFNNENIRAKMRTYIFDTGYSEVMLKLYLQIESFYLEDGYNPIFMLATHSENYIYNSKELEVWELFIDNNLIWYVFDNERGVYENEFSYDNQAYSKPIISSAKRFDSKKYGKAEFNEKLLLEISLDVQNTVLPNLITLIKKNEEGLPFVFKYFIACFAIIVLCGVVIKTFFDLFYPLPLIDLLSILITIAVLMHMSISLKFILRDELYMDTKTDYV
jgi:hypothetical protein